MKQQVKQQAIKSKNIFGEDVFGGGFGFSNEGGASKVKTIGETLR